MDLISVEGLVLAFHALACMALNRLNKIVVDCSSAAEKMQVVRCHDLVQSGLGLKLRVN